LKGFVYVDIESVLYSLDKRAYEQFIEHLDRCIYGSIWVGEGSKIVNIKGYRLDVLNAVKEIRPSAFYPLMGVLSLSLKRLRRLSRLLFLLPYGSFEI